MAWRTSSSQWVRRVLYRRLATSRKWVGPIASTMPGGSTRRSANPSWKPPSQLSRRVPIVGPGRRTLPGPSLLQPTTALRVVRASLKHDRTLPKILGKSHKRWGVGVVTSLAKMVRKRLGKEAQRMSVHEQERRVREAERKAEEVLRQAPAQNRAHGLRPRPLPRGRKKEASVNE